MLCARANPQYEVSGSQSATENPSHAQKRSAKPWVFQLWKNMIPTTIIPGGKLELPLKYQETSSLNVLRAQREGILSTFLKSSSWLIGTVTLRLLKKKKNIFIERKRERERLLTNTCTQEIRNLHSSLWRWFTPWSAISQDSPRLLDFKRNWDNSFMLKPHQWMENPHRARKEAKGKVRLCTLIGYSAGENAIIISSFFPQDC